MVFNLFGYTAKLNPIAERTSKEFNVHLKYEHDSLNHFLLYKGFVVHFNKQKKVPNYTIHRIEPAQLIENNGFRASRKNSPDFIVEERLKGNSAARTDYYKSGYDRGHHVPAGDFVYSQPLKDETFTYANVSPQLKQVNRYSWKYLESAIRKKVKRCNCDAYVITGTHFLADYKTVGSNKVGVPNQLYKIVFYPKQAKMYAFLMNNSTAKYSGKLKYYQVTVDELEEVLEMDFFEALQDENENELERQIKRFKA
jgi:endonuclease G